MKKKSDEPSAHNVKLGKTLGWAIGISLFIWLIGILATYWIANNWFATPKDGSNINNPALLGESAGVINALISALAFAGVIVAIILQRTEIKLQREDLELQREELKKTSTELALQKQEFEIQNKTLQLQRFENTFFQMLTLQQEITNGLHCIISTRESGRNKELSGREIFCDLFIKAFIYSPSSNSYHDGVKNIIHQRGINIYTTIRESEYFDHYFRHLYRLILFIDSSYFLSFEEKYSYTCIVRATLSRYELVWLFYNGLSDYGNEKFKPLIEEYSLLKNLRKELLASEKDTFRYKPSAFQRKADVDENIIELWKQQREQLGLC